MQMILFDTESGFRSLKTKSKISKCLEFVLRVANALRHDFVIDHIV